MKDIEEKLDPKVFQRIHRSFIVNINHIEKIDGHHVYINGKGIPITQTYRTKFYEVIKSKGF
ncbi:MAG: LytTR family DNA-binding domain-containing protein [Bacteroidota bacterium]